MSALNIDLWVSAGSSGHPYYRFYEDAEGSQELQNLVLDTSKSYTFWRLNEATSHPFYISDTGFKQDSSNALLITGYGSPSQGITGNQSFTIEFTDSAADTEQLFYYCSSHSWMQGNFELELQYPIVRGNSLYAIVEGPSWTEAEANSINIGGHLVSINNMDENDFLVSNFKDANQSPYPGTTGDVDIYWNGLLLSNNSWSWSNGESFEFTNWGYQAPWGNGDRGQFIVEADNNLTEPLWSDTAGKWNDMYDDLRFGGGWHGISEIPFIRRGDSAYVIVEGPTWEEAEANANALGGHLVTINDTDENEWLFKTYRSHLDEATGLIQPDEIGGLYIGLSDLGAEGVWSWSEGIPLSGLYSNWAPGNPSNSNNNPSGGENYGEILIRDAGNPSNEGMWNDTSGTYQGIAEIKLAPNNTPTGTPSLTGDFKVGQTISIDASKIEDTDNHDYWTPTYEYSWEIADDPGLTTVMPIWESLKTADAIDGNKTLEITPNLKGKLIRGLVSYVDGYGTNEVVESVSKLIKQPFDNLIGSVSGKGKLRGTKYVDQFTFNHFELGKNADKIIGYDSSQGDTIAISATAFPSLQDSGVIAFASASTKKELKQLREMNYHIIYFQKKGRLFFNGNGADKGWGDPDEGGLFAILKGKPELSVDDFTLLA